ncbi:MAG: outer membrane beta-barrel protein [Bacteroidales bacterium]|nr:outer membrane beta-barrel protein [Bacteroidales bacterium]MDY3911947.1 outer membrane beta-barrel protein [Sodaliphilus sp.]
MNKLLSIIALAAALLAHVAASAATINGIVVDAADTTELVGATVKLLRATPDSSFVAGTATDAHGVFNLRNVPRGKYYLKFSYLGYSDAVRRVSVEGRDVNMGAVALGTGSIRLKEAVVVGVKTPITVKEDTVEYNADTYKTQSNAVVEDLLKRLPGVEVGSDGKVTANGKSVTKILIDGKEFFSDDPTVASKNIPANMVDKLQVIDRKSDLARLTGVDDGEDETVINLTVKKGMNNGWFGTATAGYGTDSRYMGNVMANYFSGGNQLTLMGGGNNTNNLGFTDGGASRFQRFGGSNGITTSQNAGINFNVGTRDSERLRIGGDVMYSHSDRDTRSSRDRTYLFPDSASYYRSASLSRDKGHNVRGDFRIKWEVDSQNTLEFRPNFSFNFSNSAKSDSSMTRAGDAALTPVNRSLSSYANHGSSYEAEGQLVWNRKVKSHPGRSYSAQLRYSYSNVDEDGNTYTRNTYFLKPDPGETIDQIYDNHRLTNGVNGRLTWTEPLGSVSNARFLTVAYRANYRVSKANKAVYDITRQPASAQPAPSVNWLMADLLHDAAFTSYIGQQYGCYALTDGVVLSQIIDSELGPELERTFNESQSNNFRNRYFNQSMQVGFRQVRKAYNLNMGLTVQSAMSASENLLNSLRTIPSRWVWSVAPYARLRYKFSNTRNMAFDYRMRSSQPSLTKLQPVADVSNPLNIVIGNPELKPTFTHRINARYSDFNQGAQRSIMAMMNVNFEQNSIISKTDYNSTTGGRTTTYTNVGGVWNAMGMNMLSFPFGSQKIFYFTNHLFVRYSQTKGYNNGKYNRSATASVSESPGLALRNGVLDIELRPRYSFQTTNNTVQTSGNRNIHTYGGMFNATVSAPFGLVVSTDLSYSATSGYASGYNTRQWLWNGSVGYQFLRDKQASIQLSVYDILGQRKSVNRNTTASYIEDAAYNSLSRYGMLSFTYRFTTFKKGQQPKDRRDDGDHPGPRRGFGGRPPMGPPPGRF